ncbi:hypothetical protein Hdeb2414_s0080g00779831 [Helianthus debilis subsp. tardiflorus]
MEMPNVLVFHSYLRFKKMRANLHPTALEHPGSRRGAIHSLKQTVAAKFFLYGRLQGLETAYWGVVSHNYIWEISKERNEKEFKNGHIPT